MPKLPRSTLTQIENLLVAEIPLAVKSAQINEPVYCLRIWYNGTDCDETAVPSLMLVKESTRQQILAKYGPEATEFLWGADEVTADDQSFQFKIVSQELNQLYKIWYDYLCAVEDDEEIQPFREMVQRVAQKLNSLHWSNLIRATSDFVVFPADGSHTFCDDIGDLMASISPSQLAIFQKRGWIPSA